MTVTFRLLSAVLAVLVSGCIGLAGADDLTPHDPVLPIIEQEERAGNATPDFLNGSAPDEQDGVIPPATQIHSAPSPEMMVEGESAMFYIPDGSTGEVPAANAELSSAGELEAITKETLIETALLYYINLERANKGLPPYIWNTTLASVAKTHTLLMISSDYGSHTVPGESSLATRLTAAGIPWLSYGECISFGYPDLDADTIASMMIHDMVWHDADSDWGHRRIILDGLTNDPGYPTPTVYGFNLAGTGASYGSLRFLGGTRYTGWHATIDFVRVAVPYPEDPVAHDHHTIFRNGEWYMDMNRNCAWDGTATDLYQVFGMAGDKGITGDWDGDSLDEIAVYRNGEWYLDMDRSFSWSGMTDDWYRVFGIPGDIPVAGDWNDDGTDEIGVYREGIWYFDLNGNFAWDGMAVDTACALGFSTDKPVVGDWNEDGLVEIGVFRNGEWYLDMDRSFSWSGTTDDWYRIFGMTGDTPVAGDWNEDGLVEIGVFRNGEWYLDMDRSFSWSGTTDDWYRVFGMPGDTPLALAD